MILDCTILRKSTSRGFFCSTKVIWTLGSNTNTRGSCQGSITALAFQGSTHMLSASEDGTLAIWRTRDWECLKVLRGHKCVRGFAGFAFLSSC